MPDLYPWIKALHVIAVISWMAGMLYLPRLFVYHAGLSATDAKQSELFKTMEYRLLRFIMTPAMIVTWLSGLTIAFWSGYYQTGWLQGKFALVLVLSGVHGWLARLRKDFARDTNRHDGRFFRILNEVPTLLMILIVILVVVKPEFR